MRSTTSPPSVPRPPPAPEGATQARASHAARPHSAEARRPMPSRRRPLTEAERTALVGAEQARAKGLCEEALAQTPEAYRSFIVLIAQTKKLGDRDDPAWAPIQLPYMTVDGRVKMARDEHKTAGKKIDIPAESAFVEDPVSKQLLSKVTVRSELYGSAVAHARVFVGGSGPNDTNPLETAETSAVGRALGFLGYGCFGTGIASADEVLRVLKRPEAGEPSATGSTGSPPTTPPSPGPPSPREAEITELARRAGLRQGELALFRAQAKDDDALIGILKARLPKESAATPGTTARPTGGGSDPTSQRGDFLRLANELDVPTKAYMAFLKKEYGVGHPGDLTDEHAAREAERFVTRKSRPASAKKFREVCLSLVPPTS